MKRERVAASRGRDSGPGAECGTLGRSWGIACRARTRQWAKSTEHAAWDGGPYAVRASARTAAVTPVHRMAILAVNFAGRCCATRCLGIRVARLLRHCDVMKSDGDGTKRGKRRAAPEVRAVRPRRMLQVRRHVDAGGSGAWASSFLDGGATSRREGGAWLAGLAWNVGPVG